MTGSRIVSATSCYPGLVLEVFESAISSLAPVSVSDLGCQNPLLSQHLRSLSVIRDAAPILGHARM